MPPRYWVAACLVSVLPDGDAALHHSGVPYEHAFGHRGFFHSLFFAAIAGGVAAALVRNAKAWPMLFLLCASHGVIDATTDAGLGIAFFAPFDDTRYFFDWRPLRTAPIGIAAFFSRWGIAVMSTEIFYVWLPLTLLLLCVEVVRRARATCPPA